jgi:hypothetical protein
MAKVKMYVRDVSYRLKQTKDGPTQYARVVCHVEIPDKKTKVALDALTDDQKGEFMADLSATQLSLPDKAEMKG